MVYPAERERLLFENLSDDTTIIEQGEIAFHRENVGLVGQLYGQEMDVVYITRVELKYPINQHEVKSIAPFYMSANLLRSGAYVVDILNLDMNRVDKLIMDVDLGEVTGTPKLEIKVNETVIHSAVAQPDQRITLTLPKSLLNKDTKIDVVTKFGGAKIWQSQRINIDSIKIDEYYYDATQPSDTFDAILSKDPESFGSMSFLFNTEKKGESSTLKITLDDKTIYEDIPEDGDHLVYKGVADLDLQQGTNKLYFETSPGGVYTIRAVDVRFYAPKTGQSVQEIVFNVPKSVIDDNEPVVIQIEITEIVAPGKLELYLKYPSISYFSDVGTKPGEIDIQINEPKYELKQYGNTLVLRSSDGKFYIDDVKIIVGEESLT